MRPGPRQTLAFGFRPLRLTTTIRVRLAGRIDYQYLRGDDVLVWVASVSRPSLP
jgi:hypothetical protein